MLFQIEESIDVVLAYLSKIVKRFPIIASSLDDAVLLKNLGGIGDYLLLTPAFKGYRSLFPGKKIVLIVRNEVLGFAKSNPYVDSVISLNFNSIRKNPIEKLRIWRSLLKYRFFLAVNLDYSTTYDALDNSIFRWSCAERKVAFRCLDRRAQRNYALYDIVVNQEKEWMFEMDRNEELLRFLGYKGEIERNTQIWGLANYELSAAIHRIIAGSKYYVVSAGSLLAGKCWPPEKFGSLVRGLASLGYVAVLTGSKNDESINKRILEEASLATTIDLTGKTSLMDFALLVKNAEFLVSNDSSPAHIAQAVATKAFVILGGGHFGRFLPYPGKGNVHLITMSGMDCFNCYWNCIYDYFKCVYDIQMDTVLKTILRHLDSNSG